MGPMVYGLPRTPNQEALPMDNPMFEIEESRVERDLCTTKLKEVQINAIVDHEVTDVIDYTDPISIAMDIENRPL